MNGGGSGGHSSDDDQIALLKKRNFRDFQKQCTVSGGHSSLESVVDLCDETKLLKLYEHERSLKKAKYSHHSGLLGSASAMDYHIHGHKSAAFYGQRGGAPGSLKRKRKDFSGFM